MINYLRKGTTLLLPISFVVAKCLAVHLQLVAELGTIFVGVYMNAVYSCVSLTVFVLVKQNVT
jgi:hypothetical protein